MGHLLPAKLKATVVESIMNGNVFDIYMRLQHVLKVTFTIHYCRVHIKFVIIRILQKQQQNVLETSKVLQRVGLMTVSAIHCLNSSSKVEPVAIAHTNVSKICKPIALKLKEKFE